MYPTDTTSQKIQLFLKVFFPILCYQLANFSAQFIDTMMTGKYDELHLAGVAVAGSLWAPFFTFLSGIISAIVPIVSHQFGMNQVKEVKHSFHQFLYLACCLAIVLFVLGGVSLKPILQFMGLDNEVYQVALNYLYYLSFGFVPMLLFTVIRSFIDALGATSLSMKLMVFIVPLNILLNIAFIYGKWGFPQLGGPGAGLGTALSYWILLGIAGLVLWIHPFFKGYSLFTIEQISFSRWKEAFRIGVPIGASIFAEVAIFAFVGLLMTKFDSVIIASHQAAMNFANLSYAFPMSISSALTIVVGYELGRKDRLSVLAYIRIGMIFSVSFACLTLCLVATQKNTIAHFYGEEAQFIDYTMRFLGYSLLFQLFDAVAAPIQGVLRGFKDVNIPFLLGMVGFLGIGLPSGFLLDYGMNFGPYSYWLALMIGVFTNGVLLFFRLKKQILTVQI